MLKPSEKISVNPATTATDDPMCSCRRNSAAILVPGRLAPIPAKAGKTKPVTSIHSWWATPAKMGHAGPRTPLDTAPRVRERPACWAATLAAIPNLRATDTLFILCDFSNNPVRRRGTHMWQPCLPPDAQSRRSRRQHLIMQGRRLAWTSNLSS